MKEVCFSEADVERLLSSLNEHDILVGGQALAFWVGYYKIGFRLPDHVPAISMDGDILGNLRTARRIAAGMGGRTMPAPRDAVTILVAQVAIARGADSFLNVDVIDRVNGLTNEEIRKRAMPIRRKDKVFWVMHPLDVFVSRVRNILTIAAKQDEKGRLQLELGILVARQFIEDVAARDQLLAAKAASLAFDEFRESGKAIWKKWGVDLFDAIPMDSIALPEFTAKQRGRMIAAHEKLVAKKTARPG